ncbi:cell division cycle protein 20 homolog [Onthophagus taurus]|uniref:cell division cycle protein 20 homolog n=1 Tax=Onthophagus taurus TaxID=166361 RepID=UPI000C201E09|nr:cell division cycle protein 20 homolog [Onthophagus taurus]
MAQFRYVNEINSLLNVDGPITTGPTPRWQRKGENNLSTSNISLNSSKAKNSSANTSSNVKTPSKRGGSDVIRTKKTPSKTPSKSKSPGRATTPKPTPNKGSRTPGGDRFIPVRSAAQFELGHYLLNQTEDAAECPAQMAMQKVLVENLHGTDMSKPKILSYQKKASSAPEGFQNPMRVLYTQAKTPASVKNTNRYIPQAPDRILDAPDIVDDFYLNLIDWSGNNILAAALGTRVYLWNAGTGKIDELVELPDTVCSLSWIQEGDYLAIGTTQGTTDIWDCATSKRLRAMDGHSARVGSLAWNSYVVSSGSRSGQIIHHDVRQREHQISVLSGHTHEVCGLKWSTDGKYLASGGNDNVLNVWQTVNGGHHTNNTPLFSFTQHQAAVKALAWCPWQPHILASGGGTADRHIRFWNCNIGSCINSVDTKSQVCSLLWSTNYKELVSGHGFANNQLIIWKYAGMTKVAELTGHTARVLHLAISPDGSTVLSAGADETLRLWNCFAKNPVKAKEQKNKEKPSILKSCIR